MRKQNITNLEVWSKDAICGLIYKLGTKENNLWVNWMWRNCMKKKFLWSVKTPNDCSWGLEEDIISSN
ncbi:hypothetical protein FRX31_007258 [Thalictrum thalictroides]|uniref:Uncharacterized protein n=1 Tax=Thalictrum thalictroides TaxID=46969 RepID=A0A7J6X091_THATH|nr:hypothetical protein FRX31_007258 [Thalictrum thalictroides]